MNLVAAAHNFYAALTELSSLELQRKYWLNEDNKEQLTSSFYELVNTLNDGELDTLVLGGKMDISCQRLVRSLIDQVNSYQEPKAYGKRGGDELIINDPAWQRIVGDASQVLGSDCLNTIRDLLA